MSVNQTLEERGSRYGCYHDHATASGALWEAMRAQPGWDRLTSAHKHAITMIAEKMGRILSGDPNYADNWHDIQGYARLGEQNSTPTQPEENAG